MKSRPLASIPAVERVLQALPQTSLPRPAVVAAVREELARLRKASEAPDFSEIIRLIGRRLHRYQRAALQPVINGTGVLLHTNLGRAPLASPAVEALTSVASGYSNLEFDLSEGRRGRRGGYVESQLALLCQAPQAAVVNNCAAALMLILRRFTANKSEVLISRGELVQIGGGFRIPEILEASGAQLKEVGTTNQTRLQDYAKALSARTGLILKVHRSNFHMEGFVASPSTQELAAFARKKRVLLVEDLGSGAVWPTEKAPSASLPHEPTPPEALRQGADLVCFSGDKLLGGPQAGIIAGKSKHVRELQKDPFFRALRCDKLILAALQATVDLYLQHAKNPFDAPLPLFHLLSAQKTDLESRARNLARQCRDLPAELQLKPASSRLGGGTLPQAKIPSVSLAIRPRNISSEELSERLRDMSPPVIGLISQGLFQVDLRTVFPAQDRELGRSLRAALLQPEHDRSDTA